MSATPGPNNTVAFSTGLNYGFFRVWAFALGVSIGLPLMVVSVAWGLGAGEIFAAFPAFYTCVRYAGIAYILYLSWKIASATPTKGEGGEGASLSRCPTFFNGVLFTWMNPKAWLLAITGVTTYVGRDLPPARLAFFCGTLAVMCLLSLGAWGLGGALSSRLIRSARVQRVMNISMGLLLASSILTL
jgi:threonine/homoserine/homoserine lactone efflux protein